jgi:hypothetical protein
MIDEEAMVITQRQKECDDAVEVSLETVGLW